MCILDKCFVCFENVVKDESSGVKDVVESVKYLVSSGIKQYIELSQNILLDIVSEKAYPSKFKYETIIIYSEDQMKRGILTHTNAQRLMVNYDEDFLIPLQMAFFYDTSNDHRYRILSGQCLLQLKNIDESTKEYVETSLLNLVKDGYLDEDTRADAADVLRRLASDAVSKEAFELITLIGTSGKNKSIYDNSQNIHKFDKQILKIAEKIYSSISPRNLRQFSDISNEIFDTIRLKTQGDNEKKMRAMKAMNRISIDTATFTKRNINLSTFISCVWIKISTFKETEQDEIKTRLVEELIDMGETCSSGHFGRLVNVFSHYDDSIKITWTEQIYSNIQGRINAKIRDCEDEELKESIISAMSDDAEEKDKEIYITFINNNIKSIRDEMESEFVGGNYLPKDKFRRHFNASFKKFAKSIVQ